MKCPHCDRTDRQNKVGKTVSGRQRYCCMFCNRKYTPNPKPRGYPIEMHRQAIEMYVDGMNLRKIARHVGINHQTIANWVRMYAEQLSKPPTPKEVQIAEFDEMRCFLSLRVKKQDLHLDPCRQRNSLFPWFQGRLASYPAIFSTPG